MSEAVRLLIWDLDDTFWNGTLTEGGIEEYIEFNHDLVIALARRGIMSSICSKNDQSAVFKILDEKGIRDYFVFPSISWASKGERIANIVERIQLRPENVMFIDDHPGNRAEAKAFVPQLQVEDTPFLRKLLSDARFIGKADPDLARLKQYKILETRERDENVSSCSREEFLKNSDIRLRIEFDIEPHLDRAIELINRTNQLNFTKNRLPEDLREARELLSKELKSWSCRAGLVQVVDKYGDYGFVGFFLTYIDRCERVPGDANLTLKHFCFSCRTLGMLVEKWVYEFLGRPELVVRGEVLTNLFERREVDWILQVTPAELSGTKAVSVAPEIRFYGGCEANAIGVYLNQYSEKVQVWGNFRAGCFLVRINSAALLLSNLDQNADVRGHFATEMKTLGLPLDLIAPDFFGEARTGTVFIFCGALDAGPQAGRYRHRHAGWEIALGPTVGQPVDLTSIDATEWAQEPGPSRMLEGHSEQFVRTASHIAANYELIKGVTGEKAKAMAHKLILSTPTGSKFIMVLNDERVRGRDNIVKRFPFISRYNETMSAIVGEYPYAQALSFTDVIESDDQIQMDGNHYDRMVYLKLAERIVETIRVMPAREN